jgi:hypothetical protein
VFRKCFKGGRGHVHFPALCVCNKGEGKVELEKVNIVPLSAMKSCGEVEVYVSG